ncbi:VPLPA-CTERM sorting domain-containing protein [Primorskyibacter sp. 2E107]|uniref:VPLPA-CTERM sorting domain-containing protein n=1 Tax=Primorskyibacter sp. 2E107 TaxID=3403458 RepID=UPI003AF90311
MKILKTGLLVCSALAIGSAVQAAVINTVDAGTGQAGTYFVPTLGQQTSSPYYRGSTEDWGWTHGAIGSPFTTASLNISAYDVDETPCGFTVCEDDVIEAYDALSGSWITLGSLAGANNAFSFSSFDLVSAGGGALLDDIAAGLSVRMNIDVLSGGWLVSLSKSVLTTDGAGPGNPNPGQVPLPAAGWMLIAGLGGLVAARRRKS